jgi:acetyl-CoA carboxylase biotin carboxyl carrier protein
MELKEIKKIVELMKDNELTKFELEEEGFRIALARGYGDDIKMVSPHSVAQQALPSAPSYAPPPAAAPAAAPAVLDEDAGLVDIKSPIVGTFYRSSSPEAEPMVSVGQRVDKDTVVCIVEAMKVMNEIKADVSGTIAKILIENATPVMFGQAIFKVKPN